MRVGILLGGLSKEREISLRTGNAVLNALKKKGHDCVAIDCDHTLPQQILSAKIDVAFIALHGPLGEDGCVQGLLEWMKIPYTGSGVLASALAMDKAVLNRISRDLEFLMPGEAIFDARFETVSEFVARFHDPFPVIVKPSREGSTINITIVKEKKELQPALEVALKSDVKVLVEEFIRGKEVTVAVLNGKVLPSIEIAPKSGFYDYASKYTKGMTEYILPARLSERSLSKLGQISETIYKTIDCSGVIRVDFIVTPPLVGGQNARFAGTTGGGVTPSDEKPYFLEVNTIPGLTETSLVPKAAAHVGMSFENLCEEILASASLKIKI